MERVQCESKIELLLEKIFETRFLNERNEIFLKRLSKQEDTESECTVLNLQIFIKWIQKTVETWSTTKVHLPTPVSSFILSLASLLSMNEKRFTRLNTDDFFLKLIDISKSKNFEESASIKLAYIKLLSSFLEHKSGIAWISVNYFWEDIFQMSLSGCNDEVTEESTGFMSKLLAKTVTYDETFANNIVKRILAPLSLKIFKSLAHSKTIELTHETVSKYLRPTLNLVGSILEFFLEGFLFDKNDMKVLILFVKNISLEEKVSYFMRVASMKSVIFELAKIIFMVEFLELYVKVLANKLTRSEIADSIKEIRSNFVLSVSQGSYDDALEFCHFGQLFWSLMESKIPQEKVSKSRGSFSVGSELLVIQIIPVAFTPLKHFCPRMKVKEVISEDFRENFIYKLLRTLNEDVMRAFYHWRKILPDYKDVFKIAGRSVHYMKNSRKYFSRYSAVIVFQALFYNLKDFIFIVKDSPESFDGFSHEMSYFAQLLDMLVVLIEEFGINWKDSIEATDVIAVAFDFVTMPMWSQDVVLQSLKLIRTAIAKCMAENMALLIERAESTINLLGPLLYAKACGDVVEVKEEILEIIYTMSQLCEDKFPSLQKVLMDSELPTLVVKMSTCDGESFVRATAIKCLQEMIQVEEIWNNALKTEDLPQKMRDILLNEAEGIVRVEAATFMCVAYEYQQFAKENLDRIYETMIYSSTTDLHWEVKIRALNFWDKVIKNHLQNQGMIDDSFPNVTFSKEHRKIVTLTDSEIRKRLLKVLGQLSSIGCLGVLMSAIKDDCDMEVSKTAVKITQRLIDLFKKYNVRSDSSTPNSPALTENGMSAAVSLSSGISVDESMDSPASSSNHPEVNEEIIDQIVNSKDVSLLKSVYTPSDYGSVSNYDIQVRKVVTPNEFLQFCQQDLNSLIAEKKNWLNGIEDLGSLLDDMLKSYEDDVNNMDCY